MEHRSSGPAGGPSSSRRGRDGAFADMVAQAAERPEIAEGLLHAYRSLSPDERRHLVSLVPGDLTRRGVSPGPALALFLAVEDDPDIARVIANAIGPPPERGRAPDRGPCVFARGNRERGAAVLTQPLQGSVLEAFVLQWGPDGLAGRHAPRIGADALTPLLAEADVPQEPAPFEITIDTLATAIWSRLRAGDALPAGLTQFAALFDPPSALVGRH